MSMFEAFPPSAQQKRLDDWISPGAILYLHCDWVTKPNKNKYIVVASIQPEMIFFMVNTEARHDPAIQTQVQLQFAGYPTALTRDCFVNCNTIRNDFTLDVVRKVIANDGARYKGKLLDEQRIQIVSAAKYADDIAQRKLDVIIRDLDVAL